MLPGLLESAPIRPEFVYSLLLYLHTHNIFMKKAMLLLAGLFISFSGICQKDMNIQMVSVKGGSFYMGCDDPQFHSEEFENERPLHRVHVSSFYIAKYEVTLGMYRKIMGMYPPAYNGVDYGNKYCDDCPV